MTEAEELELLELEKEEAAQQGARVPTSMPAPRQKPLQMSLGDISIEPAEAPPPVSPEMQATMAAPPKSRFKEEWIDPAIETVKYMKGRSTSPLGTLEMLKEEVLDPTVGRAGQFLKERASEEMLKGTKRTAAVTLTEDYRRAEEAKGRSTELRPIGYRERIRPDDPRVTGEIGKVKIPGPFGLGETNLVETAETVAGLGVELPLMLVPIPGLGGPVKPAATLLGKLGQAGTRAARAAGVGAAGNVLAATARPGESFGKAATEGALFGAALSVGGEALGAGVLGGVKLVRGAKKLLAKKPAAPRIEPTLEPELIAALKPEHLQQIADDVKAEVDNALAKTDVKTRFPPEPPLSLPPRRQATVAVVQTAPDGSPQIVYAHADGVHETVPATSQEIERLKTLQRKGDLEWSVDAETARRNQAVTDHLYQMEPEDVARIQSHAISERFRSSDEDLAEIQKLIGSRRPGTKPSAAKFLSPLPEHVDAALDYGRMPEPDGALVIRDRNDVLKIQHIHVADTFLPDEIPPEDVWAVIKKRPPDPVTEVGEPQFRGRSTKTAISRAPTETEPLTAPHTVEDATQPGFIDVLRVVRPRIGGGAGPPMKPKAPPSIAKGPPVPELPMPDRPFEPADVPEYSFEDLVGGIQDELKGRPLLQRIKGGLLAGHLRGPADMAAVVNGIQASQVIQKASEDVREALLKKFGTKFEGRLDKQLNDIFLGKKDINSGLAEIHHENPGLVSDAKTLARNLFAEKERLDKYLSVRHGIVPDELQQARDSGLLDLYMTRRYLAFAMPNKEWLNRLIQPRNLDRLKEGVDFIASELKKNKRPVSIEKLTEEVFNILRADNVLEAFKSNPRTAPLKSLLERKDIPKPLRRLLGEIESGITNIAITLGTQRALAARLDLLAEIAQNPLWNSAARNPSLGHTYKLGDSRAFGALRGKFVGQEFAEALGNIQKMEGAQLQFVQQTLGFIKGNQVALGGIGPIVNSTMGNLYSGVLAGGLDLTRPMKSGRGFGQAWNAIGDYMNDPTGQTGSGWLVVEAQRVGADFFGFGHEEIGNPAARKFLRWVNQTYPPNKPVDMFEALGRINKYVFDNYRGAQEAGGSLLDITDRFFRMQSYIALREKFLADFAKRGAKSYIVREGLLKLSPEEMGGARTSANNLRLEARGIATRGVEGVTHQAVLEAVARLAARRVNQSFWNPTFIGPALDKLRRYGAGTIVSTYATAAFEATRINAMLPRRLMNEPDLWVRLGAATAFIGGVAGANSLAQHLNGISEDEIKDAYAAMSKQRRYHRFASFVLPWRDSKGRVQILDVTRWWDPFRYGTGVGTEMAGREGGDAALAALKRVGANVALSFTEGSLLERVAREPFEVSGMMTPEGSPKPLPLYKRNGLALLNWLRNEIQPGAVRSGIEGLRRGGVIGSFGGMISPRRDTEEQLTPSQMVQRGLGFTNIEPVATDPTSPSQQGTWAEYKTARGENRRQRKSLLYQSAKTPEERARWDAAYDQLIQERIRQIQEMQERSKARRE